MAQVGALEGVWLFPGMVPGLGVPWGGGVVPKWLACSPGGPGPKLYSAMGTHVCFRAYLPGSKCQLSPLWLHALGQII